MLLLLELLKLISELLKLEIILQTLLMMDMLVGSKS